MTSIAINLDASTTEQYSLQSLGRGQCAIYSEGYIQDYVRQEVRESSTQLISVSLDTYVRYSVYLSVIINSY